MSAESPTPAPAVSQEQRDELRRHGILLTSLSAGALFAMLAFILLLAEGLVWSWHRGYLEWK